MRISVVVPTRERPELLRRCLEALRDQEIDEAFEVVVVDDSPTGHDVTAPSGLTVRVAASGGRGPAIARNTGIAIARGEIILFTDDDTQPDRGWIRSAVTHLDTHSDHVGVEGPTCSPSFDHLYEHSVRSDARHSFLTCNIAYRRSALRSLNGFFEGFPAPHCEDRDLGFRAVRLGPVEHCEGMVVVHPPRPVTRGAIIKRGRLVASELELMSRHPDRYLGGGRSPTRVVMRGSTVRWLRIAWVERRQLLSSPGRMARFVTVAAGQLGVAGLTLVWAALRRNSPAYRAHRCIAGRERA